MYQKINTYKVFNTKFLSSFSNPLNIFLHKLLLISEILKPDLPKSQFLISCFYLSLCSDFVPMVVSDHLHLITMLSFHNSFHLVSLL